jgi:phenylalanyl-tRNA synthetase beta chain
MLVSYHWLKKFSNIKQSPQQIADQITLNLVEVESIEKKGDDTILTIENKGITNRQDCFSQLGLAREVAAYFNLKVNDPLEKLSGLKFSQTKKIPFKVEINSPSLCYRYTSIVLTGVKVKPSPKWLKVGVENCGIRSINNVVDITNYVMLELGQPLHAFDYEKLEDKKIIVRKAKTNESIETLDGEKRKLNKNILVIADAKNPLGIAGIMGGAKSEITNKTKTIVLESANFNKINNRQSEKSLKLRTEASTRFEKGLDINLTLPALNRAVELLQKLAFAKVCSKTIDIQSKKVKPWKIKTSIPWINQFLGLNLNSSQIIKILKRLQLPAKEQNKTLTVVIPTFRPDLKRPADIAEEIARIYGYDNIPISPIYSPIIPPKPNPVVNLRRKTKEFLKGAGFTEILTQPFLGKRILKIFNLNPENHLKIINPLTVDQEYLRRSLIPSLLPVTKKNLRFFNNLKLFEIDRIFIPQGKKQPKEIIKLSALTTGKQSYLNLKGALEALMEFLGIEIIFKPALENSSFWQQAYAAEIVANNKKSLGKIGKIKKTILSKLEINTNVSLLEINFSKISKLAKLTKIYQPILKYPPIIEDLSFVINPKVYYSDLVQLIKEVSSIIQSIELIDSYKNSLAFRITYQNPQKNLTDEEVGEIRKKIIAKVIQKGLGKLKGKD